MKKNKARQRTNYALQKIVNLTQQNKKIKNIQWIVITCEQHELLLQTEL